MPTRLQCLRTGLAKIVIKPICFSKGVDPAVRRLVLGLFALSGGWICWSARGASEGEVRFPFADQPILISQHMASFAAQGSSFPLLSVPDLTSVGDRDFDDLVFAIDFGTANLQALANPEPSRWPTFAVLAGAALTVKLRRGRASLSDLIISLIGRSDVGDKDRFVVKEVVADIQSYETPIDEHQPGEERA